MDDPTYMDPAREALMGQLARDLRLLHLLARDGDRGDQAAVKRYWEVMGGFQVRYAILWGARR